MDDAHARAKVFNGMLGYLLGVDENVKNVFESHGGVVTSDLESAELVIKGPNDINSAQIDLLKELETLVLHQKYITECVGMGRLLSITKYAVDLGPDDDVELQISPDDDLDSQVSDGREESRPFSSSGSSSASPSVSPSPSPESPRRRKRRVPIKQQQRIGIPTQRRKKGRKMQPDTSQSSPPPTQQKGEREQFGTTSGRRKEVPVKSPALSTRSATDSQADNIVPTGIVSSPARSRQSSPRKVHGPNTTQILREESPILTHNSAHWHTPNESRAHTRTPDKNEKHPHTEGEPRGRIQDKAQKYTQSQRRLQTSTPDNTQTRTRHDVIASDNAGIGVPLTEVVRTSVIAPTNVRRAGDGLQDKVGSGSRSSHTKDHMRILERNSDQLRNLLRGNAPLLKTLVDGKREQQAEILTSEGKRRRVVADTEGMDSASDEETEQQEKRIQEVTRIYYSEHTQTRIHIDAPAHNRRDGINSTTTPTSTSSPTAKTLDKSPRPSHGGSSEVPNSVSSESDSELVINPKKDVHNTAKNPRTQSERALLSMKYETDEELETLGRYLASLRPIELRVPVGGFVSDESWD